jgi:hypothetical protein
LRLQPQILNGMAINLISHIALPFGLHKSFAALFSDKSSDTLIKNVFTEVYTINIRDNLFFPITKNDESRENSFVCSPYTAYALYAKDELRSKVPNKLLQFPILLIIRLLGLFFKLGQIDRNIHINNFLLSTNPYPEWDGTEIAEITEVIKNKYPHHAIIFRSLNVYQHSNLIAQFDAKGYDKIGSRQVYIFDTSYNTWMTHNNNKNDLRLIKNKKLNYISHDKMSAYLEEALVLYNLLYLEKYSQYNPKFTLAYFKKCHEENLMHFQGYTDAHGKLKAFSGLFVLGDTITSPLVGYDIHAPKKDGLYIHAIYLIMLFKFKSGKLLNLSSGASQFKRLRGGVSAMEYSVVYCKHLPFYRRIVWMFLKFVSNEIGIPLMEKYEL